MKRSLKFSLLCLAMTGACVGDDEHNPSTPCGDAAVPEVDAAPPPDAPTTPTYSFCPVGNSTVSQGCCTTGSFTQTGSPEVGMWIRGESSSMVYYYASNGKRYVFPTQWTIVSWSYGFSDERLIDGSADTCANVVQVPDTVLASILIGGNVRYRPGSFATGLESDPSRWVVAHNGTLRRLAAPEMVDDIYHPEPAEARIRLLPDAFFTNYDIGNPVNSSVEFHAPTEFAQASIECETAGCTTTIGTMTYALEPDDFESKAGLVIGGAVNVALAKIRFTATNEAMELSKLRFRMTEAELDQDVIEGVVSMSLYDGSTFIAGPAFPDANGFVDFSGFSFIVPQDGSKTLTVKATLNQVGPNGARSGVNVGVTVCSGDNTASCWASGAQPMTYEVRGLASGVIDTIGNSGNIQARRKILRKTRPSLGLVTLPTQALANGTQVVAKFTVMANAAGDLGLKSPTFELILNDSGGAALSVSTPTIREVGQTSDIPHGSAVTSCTGSGPCLIPMSLVNEQVIPAGQSRTYEFRMILTGADVSGESISTRLIGDTSHVTGSLGVQGNMIGTGVHRFIWSDRSAVPHIDAIGGSADWTNGTLVQEWPMDPQSLFR